MNAPRGLDKKPYAKLLSSSQIRHAASLVARQLIEGGISEYDADVAIEDRDQILILALGAVGISEDNMLKDNSLIGHAVVDLANWIMKGPSR